MFLYLKVNLEVHMIHLKGQCHVDFDPPYIFFALKILSACGPFMNTKKLFC